MDSIGDFEFIRLHGDPVIPSRTGMIVSRPGVNGIGAIRAGIQGEPFRLRSLCDFPTMEAAHIALGKYRASAWFEFVKLVKENVDYFQLGVLFLPINVQPVSIRMVGAPVGRTINTPLINGVAYLVEAEWELIGQFF